MRGKRVLELGAGCGLVGITASILGATEVILTDLPYCLPLMQANVNHHRADSVAKGCQKIECTVCDWFAPPNPTELGLTGECNVILAADCVWLQELVQPFLNTLEKLVAGSDDSMRVIIAYQQRGKAVHEEFWNGIHSLFNVVRGTDWLDARLNKPDCLYLLDCYNTLD